MRQESEWPQWFDPADDRLARAVWSRLAEPGDGTAVQFVQEYGAAEALRVLIEAGPRPRPAPARHWLVRLPAADPRRDLAWLERYDGRLLIPGDPEWPGRLDDLGVRQPFCLWVRGCLNVADAAEQSVAMVGARACTEYGERVATDLALGLADRRYAVVSGAAYGIDAAAHRAALSAAGPTVAVLASGVDRPYPTGNQQLISRIAAEGSLISEMPPGCAPTRWRFLHRNRLIAALTQVTVVVEAAWRSGASVTAREAAELSRPVAAVPGPVTSAASAGCHRLLREGAVCVTDAAEVVELIAPAGEQLRASPAVPRADHDGLPPIDVRVLDAVPLRRPASIGRLALVAGLAEPEVTASLGRLELIGLIRREGDGWLKAARRQ